MSAENNPHYRPDIDGLRAVAVLMVVVYHAFSKWLEGGYIGVDVFFVISGYLITGIILREVQAGTFTFRDFYARRARRILPAFIAMLVVVGIISWFILLPHEFANLGKHIAASSLFMQNFMLYSEVGYFDQAAELKPLLHIWSLSVEEQFYIFWPLLLVLATRIRLPIILVIVATLVASLAFKFMLDLGTGGIFLKDKSAAFYMLHTRMWELASGALLAYIVFKRFFFVHYVLRVETGFWRIAREVLAFAAIAALAYAAFGHLRGFFLPFIAVITAFILIGLGPNTLINRYILGNKAMVGIGLISYPLYLWHWPLLSLVRINEVMAPDIAIIFAVYLSFMLAWASYVFLEKPVQATARNASKRIPTLIGLGAAMCGLFACGYSLVSSQGMPNRFDSKTTFIPHPDHWIIGNRVPGISANCRNEKTYRNPALVTSDEGYCSSEANKPMSLYIYGDSHAQHLFTGMVTENTTREGFVLIGSSGCAPTLKLKLFMSEAVNSCKPHESFQNFISHDASKIVILSMMPNYLQHKNFSFEKGSQVFLPAGDNMAAYIEDMSALLKEVAAKGKKAVYFIDVPHYDFRMTGCESRPWRFYPVSPPCKTPRARYEQQKETNYFVIDALKKRGLQFEVYDPTDVFCDKTICSPIRDSQLMNYDSDHVSKEGSKLVGKHFVQWLKSNKTLSPLIN